ncbi:MAG: nucleoside triphosphate pyrophosphohydrolase [Muribaculaceae bacterium]
MSNSKEAKLKAFGELLDVLDILRIQCPWDAKQTNESLRPNTIEETMELCDALIKNNVSDIKKELGDVLLHILFYAKIADEKQQFDIADVCDALRNKLIFRHPHIFGDTKVDNAEQVLQNWEALKLKEKGGNKTVLSGVPKSLPSVIKAERIQEKSANVGFDWDKPEDVWDKVKEEIAEVETELKAGNHDNVEKEFGDLLFSIINAARLYGVRADNALELTNNKFITRFNHIEQRALDMGKKINELSLAEMDDLWNEAKNLPL